MFEALANAAKIAAWFEFGTSSAEYVEEINKAKAKTTPDKALQQIKSSTLVK